MDNRRFIFATVDEWRRRVFFELLLCERFPSKARVEYAMTYLRMPPQNADLERAA